MLIVIIDMIVYIKLKHKISQPQGHPYENAGALIANMFYYSTFIGGLISVIIVWIEYLLINLLIIICNKLHGVKKVILSIILLGGILLLLITLIKVLCLVCMIAIR